MKWFDAIRSRFREVSERHPTRVTIVATWVFQATSVASTVVLAPLLLQQFGRDGAGLWFFVLGAVAFFQLCDFGIGQSISRQIAFSRRDAGRAEVIPGSRFLPIHGAAACHAVFSTARSLFRLIAAVVGLVAILLERTVLFDGAIGATANARLTWYLVVLSAIGYFLARPYQAYLEGLCRQASERVLAATVALLGNLTLITIVIVSPRLWLMGAALALSAWIQAVATMMLARRAVGPGVWIPLPARPGLARELWGASWEQGVTSIGVYLTATVTPLLIGWLIGASHVTEYYIPWRIANVAQMALLALLLPHLPFLIDLVRLGRHDALRARLTRTGVRGSVLTLVGFGAYVLAGPRVIDWWLSGTIQPSYALLAVIAVWHALGVIQTIFWLYLVAYGVQRIAHVVILGAALNVGFSVIAIPRWGVVGAALSTLAAMALTTNWYYAWRARRLWRSLRRSHRHEPLVDAVDALPAGVVPLR